jgi:hypothetical protein
MFPVRPRRSFPPRYMQHRRINHRQNSTKPNFFSQLYNTVEKLDIEKVKTTAENLSQLYSEISPIFTKKSKNK